MQRLLSLLPQAVLLLTILIGSVLATPYIAIQHTPMQDLSIAKPVERDQAIDLCPICINFAVDFINQLLNIILSKSSILQPSNSWC